MTEQNIARPLRELAHRTTDRLDVTLFWSEETHELTVRVSDEKSGAYFELDADPAKALDVFHHPYSYAAFPELHVYGRVAQGLTLRQAA
jgi:hypothetical protein